MAVVSFLNCKDLEKGGKNEAISSIDAGLWFILFNLTVMTGVSLHGIDGIEYGIIKGSLVKDELFGTIERIRNNYIGTNFG